MFKFYTPRLVKQISISNDGKWLIYKRNGEVVIASEFKFGVLPYCEQDRRGEPMVPLYFKSLVNNNEPHLTIEFSHMKSETHRIWLEEHWNVDDLVDDSRILEMVNLDCRYYGLNE